jgi:hypothetical protein
MSEGLEAEKAVPSRAAPLMSCGRCGGIPSAVAMLDSRHGKAFRMLRCAGCGEISWLENAKSNH